jgi:hypothetical protein
MPMELAKVASQAVAPSLNGVTKTGEYLVRLPLTRGEIMTMKRVLLLVFAALMFCNSLVIPTVARADGKGGEQCPTACKP